MKKFIIATLVALMSMNATAANTDLSSLISNLQGTYDALGAGVDGYDTNDYTGTGNVFGAGGLIESVTDGANGFVDSFRNASQGVDFNATTWTLDGTATDQASLVAARTTLINAQTALTDEVTSDLLGNGTAVANTWGAAELAQARVNGGLVGALTADIQEDARDISNFAATADIQSAYEDQAVLESYFSTISADRTVLLARVNTTRSAVAEARSLDIITTAVDGNTGSIGTVANTDRLALTNRGTNNAFILVSDFFTSAVGVGSLMAIIEDSFSVDTSEYTMGGIEYGSFTDFVLEINALTAALSTSLSGSSENTVIPALWTSHQSGAQLFISKIGGDTTAGIFDARIDYSAGSYIVYIGGDSSVLHATLQDAIDSIS